MIQSQVSETSCDQQKKTDPGLMKRLPQVRNVERAWAARWLCAYIGARWGTLGGGKKEGKKYGTNMKKITYRMHVPPENSW